MPRATASATTTQRTLATTSQHWSGLNISLLWIYRGSVPPSVSGYAETFLSMTAWLVLQGSVTVEIGKQRCTATSGQWLFAKPVPRHQYFSEDAEILSVRFRIEWPNGDQLFSEGLSIALDAAEFPDLEQTARRIERTVEKVTRTRFHDASFTDQDLDFLRFIQLEQDVLHWVRAVYNALIKAGLTPNLHKAEDSRIYPILKILDTWPLEEPFRVETLAQRVGLSRSQLERIILNALGTSSKAYLDQRRLNHAFQCLRDKHIPVKQIAVETGFRHSSSFCAWFKQKTGNYPSEMEGRIF